MGIGCYYLRTEIVVYHQNTQTSGGQVTYIDVRRGLMSGMEKMEGL